ncbi:uncharacterized protein LOC129410095 [Boleophthalmus pectinirostris]|uniref:uncharacterized protein LOC129410095 n=1 Tax=Boleophthalmus pectinirostris TaxID=150288 RepID=UPI0024318531|nr:uncharacterized protein LOC129410095 [Boleophthalmus pectinirostris]
MAPVITALDVSTNTEEEKELQAKGFHKIPTNLNEGIPGADNIYLWYQKGDQPAVTRVQVTFNKEMEVGLKDYVKIEKNLNSGTTGVPIYMWYSRAAGTYDVPIVDVTVTAQASSEANYLTARGVWEQVTCNLNLEAGGNYVYAWLKRQKPIYICNVTATNTYDRDVTLFNNGYTRVDVNTNLRAEGGTEVFIWYRKTTDEESSLSALNISTNDKEYEDMQKAGFKLVDVNLNENTSGDRVYLWRKTEPDLDKVRGLVLLLNMNAVDSYKAAGINVIERSLNTGNRGATIYMCHV